MPNMLWLHILVYLLGSPLVAIAVFQSDVASRPTTLSPLAGLIEFLQFGSLFEFHPFPPHNAILVVAVVFILLFALLLLVQGLLYKKSYANHVWENEAGAELSLGVLAVTGVFVCLGILLFAKIAHSLLPNRAIKLVVATSIIPLALPIAGFLLVRYWNKLQSLGDP